MLIIGYIGNNAILVLQAKHGKCQSIVSCFLKLFKRSSNIHLPLRVDAALKSDLLKKKKRKILTTNLKIGQ